jgi:ech hydrogenase subunit F
MHALDNIFRNLFSKPVTVNYPFEKPQYEKGTRGAIRFDMDKCDQCQDCERLCPSSAIKVYPDEKRVEYDPFRCIYCHLCVENCMQEAIIHDEIPRLPEYEKNKDNFP